MAGDETEKTKRPAPVDWCQEKIDQLRELWGSGISGRKIGQIMGLNKNQVIGKAHRLNLCVRAIPDSFEKKERTPYVRKPYVRKVRSEPNRQKQKAYISDFVATDPTKDEKHLPVNFALNDRLMNHQGCMFPIGAPRQNSFRFCGDPMERRNVYIGFAKATIRSQLGPYCEYHRRICTIGDATAP